MTEPKMLVDQLRVCAHCAAASPNEFTYLNSRAKVMLTEAADEIERLRCIIDQIDAINDGAASTERIDGKIFCAIESQIDKAKTGTRRDP